MIKLYRQQCDYLFVIAEKMELGGETYPVIHAVTIGSLAVIILPTRDTMSKQKKIHS